MRYSIDPKDRIFVKRCPFLPFVKNIGTHETNVAKNINSKYSRKLLDSAKKSIIDTIKATSKRLIQKAVEATGDLIGNKTSDKSTSLPKKSKKPQNDEANDDSEAPKERYLSPEKR